MSFKQIVFIGTLRGATFLADAIERPTVVQEVGSTRNTTSHYNNDLDRCIGHRWGAKVQAVNKKDTLMAGSWNQEYRKKRIETLELWTANEKNRNNQMGDNWPQSEGLSIHLHVDNQVALSYLYNLKGGNLT